MIYAVHNTENTSDAINMDTLKLAEVLAPKMSDDVDPLMYLLNMHLTNDTLTEFWPETMSFKYSNRYKKKSVDVNILGSLIFFNGRAFDAMQGLLSSYGEFLKIEVEGDVSYLFNPLVFGEEDLTLSEQRYFNNMPTGYKNIMFKKEDVDKKALFKSKLGGAFIYCNHEFVKAFNDHNLTGIQFTLIPDYNYKEEF
ncbi:hypothetical protein MSP8887_02635 [Marinomonas spartinae]|uniref:hypothetical protein n=1 Tax=Marinomonas spartinae TaxID=1792290 RepID=UPI000808AAFD|nr:hypothetical protein [Marinomonas spartinae]SBS36569.1 hypothetical protein MSP8887_02635 [Marinomonas spartinae]